ncbi:dipeptidase PepE [Pontimicrobium sp. IMCC45349]|uniref:dipeptidase PepE n=1 Tax=Pontimicrobium sp. IMCC45349 TaxID=3391574 RepID=UPI0039A2775E
MKKLIIASTSTVHGSGFLEYISNDLKTHFKDVSKILFIPYARPGGISHNEYTLKAKTAFNKIDIDVNGIHEYDNPTEAVKNAEGIFVGGGNTFVLVDQLYKNNVISALQESINNGTPYLGTSAGSNICGLTLCTTNDMPIVYPPSFKTLAFVPFNINPHYLDPNPNSTHMGETRETRIQEFHKFNTQPVVGLREGSYLHVIGNEIILKGNLHARIFEQNKVPYEISSNTSLTNLN